MGMFDLTPYGMGMPTNTNQFSFGPGSNMQPTQMSFADPSSNGLVNPMQGFQMPSFGLDKNSSPDWFKTLGDNAGMINLGIGGLQTLGNLWGGFKSLGLANKQFDFTKMMAEKNLNNQTQSYNTALEDRINSRAKTQGMSEQDRQAYLSKNSLPK
jgi:hypothetical protein